MVTKSTKNHQFLTRALIVPCLLLAALPSYAGVVFEESFDASPDWNVNNIYKSECAGDCTTAPVNWSNYRTVPGTSALSNPTGSIRKLPGSLPDRTTGNGKAYIVYNQSVSGVNWPGDSTLVKVLPQDHPELYVRMWIRTQANWKTVASAQSKIFRSYHWDRTGNLFQFFSTGTVNPAYIWDWATNGSNNASYMDAYRCDPQETNYYCTTSGVPSYQLNDYFYAWGSGAATTKYADAQWHRYDFHLKMNDIGKNNGIMEWWWDGTLMERRSDAQWKAASGSSASIGWNTIAIGGNSNNTFSGSTPADQWYAVDDLVVSTTPIPADYVIGGGGGGSTGDTSAPAVSISSPANNATVSGTVSLTASASDNVGVSRVEYFANGALLSATNVAPFSYNWSSNSVANGTYSLTAKAYDAAGNVGQSSAVSVTITNAGTDTTAPSVAITLPANNSTVGGTVYTTVAASDNVGVTKVEYYVNGELDYTSTTAPFGFSVATTTAHNGTYTMYAKAYDAAGNVKQSSTINFTINNTTADTTAPTVSITAPAANATVSGTVNVAASASDNIGVAKVEFYVNGSLKGTDTAAPYSYSWDTKTVANGTYALSSKAYDAAGNVKQSSSINCTVNNIVADTTAPSVAITLPANNSTVSGTVHAAVAASDNVGVTKVEYYVNGGLDYTSTTAPFGFSVATTTAHNGTYSMYAKAYDAVGNVKQSSTINFTINNNTTADTTVPVISITSPAANATVSGTVNIAASASDNTGVTKVEFYVNGSLKNTDTTSPYTYAWNSTSVADGNYSITTKAFDAAGNSAESAAMVAVKNNVATSIWSASDAPAIVDVGPDSPVELGFKFRSDVSGSITGIRFYKSAANTGTHVANLWSSTGQRLATATFTNETASGWQQVNFSAPVAITANTVYVASYHTKTGHYSGTLNYFAGKGMDNGSLHALADGVSGYNGVYSYGSSSTFPTKSWKSGNYWVDVVFKK